MNNVITVNSDIPDPLAVIKSITDATAENPYFVVIGPGNFKLTETLFVKPFVTVIGSGVKVTRLTGAISSETPDCDSAIVSVSGNSVLRDLAIENTGGWYYSIALHNDEGKALIKNVSAKASGGLWSSVGVMNDVFSAAVIHDVTAIGCGLGSDHCYGVVNALFSSPTMVNVTAAALGGKYKNIEVLTV